MSAISHISGTSVFRTSDQRARARDGKRANERVKKSTREKKREGKKEKGRERRRERERERERAEYVMHMCIEGICTCVHVYAQTYKKPHQTWQRLCVCTEYDGKHILQIFCSRKTIFSTATHCNTLQHTGTYCNTL